MRTAGARVILDGRMTEIAAYGTWESPISAADVARGRVGGLLPVDRRRRGVVAGAAAVRGRPDGDRGVRRRPARAAGTAARRRGTPGPGCTSTAASPTWPCPSLSLAGGFDLVFANFADQRLYAAGGARAGEAGIEPVPLTPADGGFRFADLVLSPTARRSGACGRRCGRSTATALPDGFHVGGGVAVRRDIVAVPLDGSAADDAAAIRVLVSGAQFFAFPTPSPDGTRLAWISWNHPNMPWDGTELRVASVAGAPASGPRPVADAALVMGGPEESVLAPPWRDDATLYAISDASGWWNLYEVAAAAGACRGRCTRSTRSSPGRSGSSAGGRSSRWATGGSRCCTASASTGSACSTRPPGS